MAAMLALGAVASSAQNPCEDAEGQGAGSDKITALFKDRSIPGRKAYVEAGKAFLEKYGACESTKDLSDYLKPRIPKEEETIRKMEIEKAKADLLARFNLALTGKNYDEVYASGKEILQKYPEEFRAVELVLGSIGYDELLDRRNAKYNDDTLRFAKQSLANLEAGKEFKPGFGLNPFSYKNKDDAIAWMNLTIGSINQIGFKNKLAALPFLYRATQATGSDVAKNPNPYEFIGLYYFDELNKLVDEIKSLADSQKDTDTPEVAQQKVDQIKAKVAMSNGTAERAIDAFTRAYALGQTPAYKANMKKNVEGAYKVRFGKIDGVDTWIAGLARKPFPNPTTPITPVSDPEPVVTPAETATTTPGTATSGTTAKPGPTTPGTTAKPGPTTTVKPAPIKPAAPGARPGTGGAKPQATVKKVTVKKKIA